MGFARAQPILQEPILRSSSACGQEASLDDAEELIRLVAADRDAMAVALVGVVVPERVVLGAAVVPERNRVGLPLEAHAQLGRFDVPIEHFEDRVAFALVQAAW